MKVHVKWLICRRAPRTPCCTRVTWLSMIGWISEAKYPQVSPAGKKLGTYTFQERAKSIDGCFKAFRLEISTRRYEECSLRRQPRTSALAAQQCVLLSGTRKEEDNATAGGGMFLSTLITLTEVSYRLRRSAFRDPDRSPPRIIQGTQRKQHKKCHRHEKHEAS